MKNRGFTIIESLVAIAVLLAAIAGAGAAIQTGISSFIFSKDQIVAFYLAQEGFEQVRNIRDTNRLNQVNWLTGLPVGSPLFVDAVEGALNICPGTCPLVKIDPVNGFYGHSSLWTDTIFRRTIGLEQLNDHEVRVTVTVDWSKGLTSRSFQAIENIFKWQ